MCTYKSNIEMRWRNHCCCGIAVSILYSESVHVASSIQLVMCKRHIIYW